uniref:Uncharacterized protein n=1 Tax=Candidatus Kentrum sp. LFY TaxID=2126342 RepID=A0A450UTL7_9GAMM|nr:MAG: hypothetical protein BECKLFY1418A_GA0070994_105315 [Candidatus Kentron sp. LFY]
MDSGFWRKKVQRELKSHILNVYGIFSAKDDFHGHLSELNKMLLAKAIDNAIEDLQRMSLFHFEKGKEPDRHKYAGFVAKWIAKERPIQLIQRDGAAPPLSLVTEKLYWINALFAVHVMSSFLRGKGIPPRIGPYLKYIFSFREERGETLALIAYFCEKMSQDSK